MYCHRIFHLISLCIQHYWRILICLAIVYSLNVFVCCYRYGMVWYDTNMLVFTRCSSAFEMFTTTIDYAIGNCRFLNSCCNVFRYVSWRHALSLNVFYHAFLFCRVNYYVEYRSNVLRYKILWIWFTIIFWWTIKYVTAEHKNLVVLFVLFKLFWQRIIFIRDH